MKRRKFLKVLAGFGTAGLLTGIYAWKIEPFWLEFVKVRMPLKNLSAALTGNTVMQISDLHVGNRFSREYLIDSLKEAQQYQPDFVVYTGDFVSYETKEQFEQLRTVMKHAPKGRKGTVGILGNHDYGSNWAEPEVASRIVEILQESGITILRNEKIDLHGITFTGLDDFWGTNYGPEPILKTIDRDKPNIVLCHNPDVVDEPVWNHYNSWILSGHTHGGQCKPPFLPAPMLPVKNKRYSSGIIDISGGRTLYINRALGHLWQISFNVRPEITIFTLEQA